MDNKGKCRVSKDKRGCRLSKFFSMIPTDSYRDGLEIFETEGIKKVLKDSELRHTAELFLHNDLNLNAASKQLFMHRNTLIYRLEKIKTLTGLDLKKFCDAFIFHILMFKTPD